MSKYYLGINIGHDSSVVLLRNNKVICAIEEERLNLDKHSLSYKTVTVGTKEMVPVLPFISINYVLEEADIRLDDVDLIVFTSYDSLGKQSVAKATQYIKSSLFVSDKKKIVYLAPSTHHLMHAHNAYYTSSFKQSTVLVVDAYSHSERINTNALESVFSYKENQSKLLYRRYGEKGEIGIGAFYQFFCKLMDFNLPFNGNSSNNYFDLGHDEAGKLMGLSSHGNSFFKEKIIQKKNNSSALELLTFIILP